MAKHKVKTPIDKAPQALPKPVPKNKAVPLADALILAGAKLTPAQLKNGTYQQKLLAFFAPHLGPELLQSIRRGLIADDHQTRKLAAEMLGFIQAKSGVSIAINQTNQTANVSAAAEDRRQMRSFEEIARAVHEGRQRKALPPPGAGPLEAEFVSTPED